MSRSAWQPPSRRPSGPTTTAASRSLGPTIPTSSSPASMFVQATCRWFTTRCSTWSMPVRPALWMPPMAQTEKRVTLALVVQAPQMWILSRHVRWVVGRPGLKGRTTRPAPESASLPAPASSSRCTTTSSVPPRRSPTSPSSSSASKTASPLRVATCLGSTSTGPRRKEPCGSPPEPPPPSTPTRTIRPLPRWPPCSSPASMSPVACASSPSTPTCTSSAAPFALASSAPTATSSRWSPSRTGISTGSATTRSPSRWMSLPATSSASTVTSTTAPPTRRSSTASGRSPATSTSAKAASMRCVSRPSM